MAYRAVVVGAGGISGAWFPPLKAEGVDVVGVVDLRLEAAQERIAQHELPNAEASTDLDGTLQRLRPDVVVDLTVPEAHCHVTTTALKAGCHVIGEKPMANSMEEARLMVRTAEETGKLYMVSQSRRWNGTHATVRQALRGGAVGELTTANCAFYIGAHFGGFRDEMPSPLILDMAIHHFDLVRFFTDKDPLAVYAKEFNPRGSWYKGDVAASCIFEMSDGVIFTYMGSWCAEGCHTSWNGDWRFIGQWGTLLYEKDQQPLGQAVAGKTMHAGFHQPLEDVRPAPVEVPAGGQHGAVRELLAYLNDGTMPQGECHDNIQSLAMVFAAIESAAKGQRVEVKAL
ncbi:MAG TPA: Gfo/Idh/MocA family oxidoreductase [Armatimonadota bacterium]|nr:Gfo/Idh/MocA family oxidoreductase [Armatimonadota bacterium]HOS44691.1 Gfo/Idh/MocA family oxidoreductase [Armatimonadota bacterium]